MDACKMQYAVHNGTYVLKLRGDVRVPVCTSLETFVEQRLLTDDSLRAVLIDLTETEAIDSTALGLLARIAYTLAQANINVASARINTLGERAEDVFLIDGARLHDEQALLRLETALYEELKIR